MLGPRFPRSSWLLLALAAACAAALGAALLADPRAWGLLRNSLLLAAASAALAAPLGMTAAVILVRTDAPGRRVLLFLWTAALFAPLYLHSAAWAAGFAAQGWFTRGWLPGAAPWLAGWRGAILAHGMAAAPWAALFTAVGLRTAEPELEDAALLEGGPWTALARVSLRRAPAAAAATLLWTLTLALGEIAAVNVYRVPTFAEESYLQAQLWDAPGDWQSSPWPLAILTFLAAALGAAAAVELAPAGEHPAQQRLRPLRLGKARWLAAAAAAVLSGLVVGVPLVNLLVKAGLATRQVGDDRFREWSLGKLGATLAGSPWEFRHELWGSLQLGALTATVCLAAALPLAWWARRGKRSLVVFALAALGLAAPGPLVGLGVISLLNQPWGPLPWLYDHTLLAPILAVAAKGFPLALLVLWAGFRTLPRELEEEAATAGSGPWALLWRIAAPLRGSAVAGAWLAALAASLGDVSAAIVTVPPGVSLASVRIFEFTHSGIEDREAGLALSLLAVFAAAAGGVLLAARGRRG